MKWKKKSLKYVGKILEKGQKDEEKKPKRTILKKMKKKSWKKLHKREKYKKTDWKIEKNNCLIPSSDASLFYLLVANLFFNR